MLTESKNCMVCKHEAVNGEELGKHHEECHTELSSNLEETIKDQPVVKPIPLYKCSGCCFSAVTTDDIQEHKKDACTEKTNLMEFQLFSYIPAYYVISRLMISVIFHYTLRDVTDLLHLQHCQV